MVTSSQHAQTPSVFELRRRRDPVDISPLAKGEKPVGRGGSNKTKLRYPTTLSFSVYPLPPVLPQRRLYPRTNKATQEACLRGTQLLHCKSPVPRFRNVCASVGVVSPSVTGFRHQPTYAYRPVLLLLLAWTPARAVPAACRNLLLLHLYLCRCAPFLTYLCCTGLGCPCRFQA